MTQPMIPKSIDSIPPHIKHLLIDCDGVLFLGSQLLHKDIPNILCTLRDRGINMVFVTNNSTRSRDEYKEKMNGMGLPWVQKEDIYVSGYLASIWLKEHNYKSVYLIGEAGLQRELESHEIRVFRHENAIEHLSLNESQVANISEEELSQHECVVIGWDREFTFKKLCYAFLCLQQKRETPCGFITTNLDAFDKVDELKNIPGSGAMVASVESVTGRKALVAGKPNTFAIEHLEQTRGWKREEMLMIGDRLDSDILMASRGNIDSLLVFSGTTSPQLLEESISSNYEGIPTYTIQDLSHLKV